MAEGLCRARRTPDETAVPEVTVEFVLQRSESVRRSCSYDLAHGAITLIDGGIGVGMTVSVRVRDLDSPERLPANHTRTFRRRPVERLEQCVVLVGISVRPAVDRNCLNVASGIETAGGEDATKLISHLTLEGFEFRVNEFPPSCPVLVLAIQARLTGSAKKVKQAGFIRRTRVVIVAHGDREIQCNVAEVCSRSVDRANAEFLECFPVADLHVGVDKRSLHTVSESFLLFV